MALINVSKLAPALRVAPVGAVSISATQAMQDQTAAPGSLPH